MNIYVLFVVVIFGNICVNCIASEQKNFRNIKEVNTRKVHAGNSVDDFGLRAPSTVAFKCPFPWGHYPVAKECSSYYNCSFSKATKEKCPDDQHFDKLALKCRDKDEATCADKNIFPDKITYKCTKSWGSSAYDKDCSVYYLCLSGKPFMKQCEWNKLYDAKKNKCQNKDNVDCGSRHNPYVTTPTQTTKGTTKLVTKAPETSTTVSRTTPEHTTESSALTSETIEETHTELPDYTTLSSLSTSTEEVTELTNENTDVTSDTEISEKTISEVTHDTSTIISNVSETTELTESTSTNGDENTDSPDESTSTSTLTDIWTEYTTQESSSGETEGTTSLPEFECPQQKGKYPHETDCNKYYVCKNGEWSLRQCVKGANFHKQLLICYNEEEVDCKNALI